MYPRFVAASSAGPASSTEGERQVAGDKGKASSSNNESVAAKRARNVAMPEPEMESEQGQTKVEREGELKLDCGICLQPLAGLVENGGPCGGLLGGRARLENCSHIFCYGCIAQWADISTTCPTCRQTFSRMYVMDNEDVTLRTIIIEKRQQNWDEEDDEEEEVRQELDGIVAPEGTIGFEDNAASPPSPSPSTSQSGAPASLGSVDSILEIGGKTKEETTRQPPPHTVQEMPQLVMKIKTCIVDEFSRMFAGDKPSLPSSSESGASTCYNLTSLNAEELQRVRTDGCRLVAMISSYQPEVSVRTIVHAMLLWNTFLDAVYTTPAPHWTHKPCLSRDRECKDRERDIIALDPTVPTACFQLACKSCEVFAPPLTQLVRVLHQCQRVGIHAAGSSSCTTDPRLLYDAELNVLSVLGWDITMTPTLDQVEMLLDSHFQTDSPDTRHNMVVTLFKAFSSPIV